MRPGAVRRGKNLKIARNLGKPPNLDDLSHLGVTPAGFRYYLYTAHYRSPLSLSGEALRGAEAARRRLRSIVRAGSAQAEVGPVQHGAQLAPLREKFFDALRDDLDAPKALAVLWEITSSQPLAARARLLRSGDRDRPIVDYRRPAPQSPPRLSKR